ncbi:putative reverse transcriptase domain-containing protein [Tanacetum coccineum]
MIASTQTLIDAVTATLPSPPLPLPLYMPPPVDRRDDIPESEQPPRKRCRREAAGVRDVGYGIRDTWIDPAKAVPEIAPMTMGEVNARVTKLVELHEHDTLMSLFTLLEDALGYMGLVEEEEAYASESLAHSIGIGGDPIRRLQTHRVHACCSRDSYPSGDQHDGRDSPSVRGHKEEITDMQIRTLGSEAYAMTWEGLKKKMTEKYCPLGEIQKLEIELWNLKVKGNDVPAYTERFQELTLICTKFCANETEKINKYIRGLPNNIYGNVKSSKGQDEEGGLDSSRNNMDTNITFKKQNLAKKEVPPRLEPLCQRLQLKNKDGGNRNAQGWVYAVGNAEKRGNASGNPDSNVITELGSFDVIIGMDWLRRCHAMIVCDEKLVRVFLAQISAKKEEDKSEGKQLKDIPIVQDFPKVFTEDLPGLPLARPVEFQINLIPGAASFSLGEPRSCLSKRRMGHSGCALTTEGNLSGGALSQAKVEAVSKLRCQRILVKEDVGGYDQKGLIPKEWLDTPQRRGELESAQFFPIRENDLLDKLARFTSNFWKSFQKALGTDIKYETAYHLETNGQSKRTIQTLEDMLRACVDRFCGKAWIDNKKLRVRSKSRWCSKLGLEVMLKVSPWKGVVRFGKRGKLNPRYVGTFKVLAKVRKVAYKLELPQELSRVHNTFHASNLKKCYVGHLSHAF